MITLYMHPVSAPSKRVRILLDELDLPYQLATVELLQKEQFQPEFLAKNPNGKVPVLEYEGKMMWESSAILYEVAAKHPESNLIPQNQGDTADMLRWMFWTVAHFDPAVVGIAFERRVKPKIGSEPNEEKIAELTVSAKRFSNVLNQALEGNTWLLGDQYTIADISVGCTARLLSYCQLDLSPFNHLNAWLERLQQRPHWSEKSE